MLVNKKIEMSSSEKHSFGHEDLEKAETAVLREGDVLGVALNAKLKTREECFAQYPGMATVSQLAELNIGADTFGIFDMGELPMGQPHKLETVFFDGNGITHDEHTRYLVCQMVEKIDPRTNTPYKTFDEEHLKALRAGEPLTLGSNYFGDRFKYADSVEPEHTRLDIVDGSIRVTSLAKVESTMVTAMSMENIAEGPPNEDNEVTLSREEIEELRRMQLEEAARAEEAEALRRARAIEAAENLVNAAEASAEGAADEAIVAGTLAVGESSTAQASGDAVSVEATAAAHRVVSEASPADMEKEINERITQACSSPEAFFASLHDKAVPVEVKSKLELVAGAWMRVGTRREANKMWQEEALPLLNTMKSDIKADQIAAIAHDFSTVTEQVSQTLRGIDGAIDYLRNIQPGWSVASAIEDIRQQTSLDLKGAPDNLQQVATRVSEGGQTIDEIAGRVAAYDNQFSDITTKMRQLEYGSSPELPSEADIVELFNELGGVIASIDEASLTLDGLASSEADRNREREIDQMRSGISTLQRIAHDRPMDLLKNVPNEIGQAVMCISRREYGPAAEWLERSRAWMIGAAQSSSELSRFATFISQE